MSKKELQFAVSYNKFKGAFNSVMAWYFIHKCHAIKFCKCYKILRPRLLGRHGRGLSILYFPANGINLNKILSNGKRFMAYEIINRLQNAIDTHTSNILENALTEREKKKKQLHKVFRDSFDGKPIFSEKFLMQKLDYIHYNPVKGKWNLAPDFVSYKHSSASFYEEGITHYFIPRHYKDV